MSLLRFDAMLGQQSLEICFGHSDLGFPFDIVQRALPVLEVPGPRIQGCQHPAIEAGVMRDDAVGAGQHIPHFVLVEGLTPQKTRGKAGGPGGQFGCSHPGLTLPDVLFQYPEDLARHRVAGSIQDANSTISEAASTPVVSVSRNAMTRRSAVRSEE